MCLIMAINAPRVKRILTSRGQIIPSHPCLLLPRKGIPVPDDPRIGGKVKVAVSEDRPPGNSVAQDRNCPALLMAKQEGLELELCISIEFKQDSADSTQ